MVPLVKRCCNPCQVPNATPDPSSAAWCNQSRALSVVGGLGWFFVGLSPSRCFVSSFSGVFLFPVYIHTTIIASPSISLALYRLSPASPQSESSLRPVRLKSISIVGCADAFVTTSPIGWLLAVLSYPSLHSSGYLPTYRHVSFFPVQPLCDRLLYEASEQAS